uniref:Uncharacterized protein n=1 Tax=Octopus bimaculoides TaxID=37653 RepID=A0A0L8H7Y4_OCTBM
MKERKGRKEDRKRYRDLLKANTKKCNIDFNNWEENTNDRNLWRSIICEGAITFETNKCEELEEK